MFEEEVLTSCILSKTAIPTIVLSLLVQDDLWCFRMRTQTHHCIQNQALNTYSYVHTANPSSHQISIFGILVSGLNDITIIIIWLLWLPLCGALFIAKFHIRIRAREQRLLNMLWSIRASECLAMLYCKLVCASVWVCLYRCHHANNTRFFFSSVIIFHSLEMCSSVRSNSARANESDVWSCGSHYVCDAAAVLCFVFGCGVYVQNMFCI